MYIFSVDLKIGFIVCRCQKWYKAFFLGSCIPAVLSHMVTEGITRIIILQSKVEQCETNVASHHCYLQVKRKCNPFKALKLMWHM